LPAAPVNRDAYATDLARLFDDDSRREQIAEAWLPHLTGISCLGLPAVIGMRRHAEAFADVEQALGISIFEIPTLPPSLPGLRLESALRGACSGRGVDLIEGATVTGPAVSGRDRKRLSGVVAATAGGPRLFNAGRFVLTTGGFLNGGLVAHPDGRLCEAALGLPVDGAGDRSVWTKASMLEPQPYETLGLTVDERLRPLDNTGKPAYRNLHAAGGILAGARRTTEGSRQGIDVASAWRAVECALA
jgi:glycerol-3-phosphate dehydrogenase subunit B